MARNNRRATLDGRSERSSLVVTLFGGVMEWIALAALLIGWLLGRKVALHPHDSNMPDDEEMD